jgi:hypothetical protein
LSDFDSSFATVAQGIQPIIQGVGARIAGKPNYDTAYRPVGYYQQQPTYGGASFQASSQGILGKIDSTTLLLIAGVVAIFLLKK